MNAAFFRKELDEIIALNLMLMIFSQSLNLWGMNDPKKTLQKQRILPTIRVLPHRYNNNLLTEAKLIMEAIKLLDEISLYQMVEENAVKCRRLFFEYGLSLDPIPFGKVCKFFRKETIPEELEDPTSQSAPYSKVLQAFNDRLEETALIKRIGEDFIKLIVPSYTTKIMNYRDSLVKKLQEIVASEERISNDNTINYSKDSLIFCYKPTECREGLSEYLEKTGNNVTYLKKELKARAKKIQPLAQKIERKVEEKKLFYKPFNQSAPDSRLQDK